MHPRHQQLLDLLAGAPGRRVVELAALARVTPATVRRDLEMLQRDGLVVRTHGGAVLSRPGRIEFRFRERAEVMAAAKRAIAQTAATRVRPGMTLSLDTGTTTLAVARALTGMTDLRVLTTSLAVAAVLHPCEGICVILLGGQVRTLEPDLYGDLVEDNLTRFHVDLAILGTDGATEAGLWTSDPAIARTSRALVRGAARRLLVADSSKFGRPSFVHFAAWEVIDEVITDTGLGAFHEPWAARLRGLQLATQAE